MNYSFLDQLAPVEVFQLLLRAAERDGGQYLEDVKIVFTGPAPFKYVALEVPDPFENKETLSDSQRVVYKTLVEGFKEITGRGERYESPGGDSKPFREGLAWLLLQTVNPENEGPAAAVDEFLVVTPPIDEQRAEALFRNISFHATSVRVSSWQGPGKKKTTGGSRYLFHLKDDRKRKSSFRAVAAEGIFEDCRVLQGFGVEGDMTFLPPEAAPGERKLLYFTRLLATAPALFPGGEENGRKDTGSGMLAALVQWPGETPDHAGVLEFLYLKGIRFFSGEYFTRRKVAQAQFQYLDLKESKRSLEQLGEAIANAEPFVGYRLELRATRHLQKNDFQRLNREKARIEYSLAYLQSISKPRPVLLRFTHKQLAALAAEIRSFPMQAIYAGSLKYGFQATQSEPSGFHFLLIDPREAAQEELDPLSLFAGLDTPHMRFHLDPFWARHYFEGMESKGGSPSALIFVPEGCALFPSIHTWDRGNMGYFLRETMEQWFHNGLKGASIPSNAIYIFDGDHSPKSPIRVSVMDRDALAPLHTRLGWINDNLVIERALEKEGNFKEMAADLTWMELAGKIRDRRENARQDFTEAVKEATGEISRTTGEMTRVLTSEINRVVKETFRITQKIRRLDERLEEWDEAAKDMEQTLRVVQRKKQEVAAGKHKAANEFRLLETDIQRELMASEQRRRDLESQVAQEIGKMREATKKLKAKLRSFKL